MNQIYVCSSTLHHPVRWEGFGCITTHQNLLPKSPGTPLSSPDGCWASVFKAGSQEPQTPASAARGHGIAPRWVLTHSDLKICFYEHLFTAQLPTPLWEGYNPGDFFQDWKPRSGGNKKKPRGGLSTCGCWTHLMCYAWDRYHPVKISKWISQIGSLQPALGEPFFPPQLFQSNPMLYVTFQSFLLPGFQAETSTSASTLPLPI